MGALTLAVPLGLRHGAAAALRGPLGAARAAGSARGLPRAVPAPCLRPPQGAHPGFPRRRRRGRPRGLEVPLTPGSRPAAAMAAGLWVLLLPLAAAVYEDQVGKFDW